MDGNGVKGSCSCYPEKNTFLCENNKCDFAGSILEHLNNQDAEKNIWKPDERPGCNT